MSATADLCQSLQMVDRKTEYVLEAQIPCSTCRSIQIDLGKGMLNLGIFPKDGGSLVPIHSWDIESGVHVENMTVEYKNGTLFLRLPKSTESPRPLQYTEAIELTPFCS